MENGEGSEEVSDWGVVPILHVVDLDIFSVALFTPLLILAWSVVVNLLIFEVKASRSSARSKSNCDKGLINRALVSSEFCSCIILK